MAEKPPILSKPQEEITIPEFEISFPELDSLGEYPVENAELRDSLWEGVGSAREIIAKIEKQFNYFKEGETSTNIVPNNFIDIDDINDNLIDKAGSTLYSLTTFPDEVKSPQLFRVINTLNNRLNTIVDKISILINRSILYRGLLEDNPSLGEKENTRGVPLAILVQRNRYGDMDALNPDELGSEINLEVITN